MKITAELGVTRPGDQEVCIVSYDPVERAEQVLRFGWRNNKKAEG